MVSVDASSVRGACCGAGLAPNMEAPTTLGVSDQIFA